MSKTNLNHSVEFLKEKLRKINGEIAALEGRIYEFQSNIYSCQEKITQAQNQRDSLEQAIEALIERQRQSQD